MNRRVFIATCLSAVASRAALAQPRKHRLAMLTAQSKMGIAHLWREFSSTLEKLGYREDGNLIVERRFADGHLDRLPALAAELVAGRPDVFFASASQAALAAVKATSTIPIVFVAVADPVGLGLVKSLARPGTNATGLSAQNIEVHAKRLQLLKEAFPAASVVTVLHNPLNAVEHSMLEVLRKSAAPLHIELLIVQVRTEEDFPALFQRLEEAPTDVVYVLESPFSMTHRSRIVDFLNAKRIPALYGLPDFVEAGGLMAYSFPLLEHFRLGAQLVDKILKGAKPADLPIQQPTRFELVLNRRTARDQGIKFPPAFWGRADRVIE
jgi:putative ABC transport system substrate-binding protein